MQSEQKKYLTMMLTNDEGYRRFAYKDIENLWTWGIGRNVEQVGISLEEAVYLLNNDIKSCSNPIKKQQLLFLLADKKNYRKLAYKDASGILKIGFGRNMESDGISLEEAQFLLSNDIDNAEKEAIAEISCYAVVSDAIKIALLNMLFNMGISRLLRFKNTLQYLLNGENEKASIEVLDSEYGRGKNGPRARRISKIFLTGLLP